MGFEIRRREREGITILDLDGRLVLGESASMARNGLQEAIAGGARQIVANLADVEFIDSTGLGTLVMAATSVKKAGGVLKLLNLNRRNVELMIVTKLTTVFELFNDETDAVNSFYPDRQIKKFDILDFVKGNKRTSEGSA